MGKLLVNDKQVVVPGEIIAEGMDFIPTAGTYRDKEQVIASKLGLVNIDGRLIKLIPLTGKYMPKKGDTVIGKVIDITLNGWRLDINSAYSAMLILKDATSQFIARGADLTRYFSFGDCLVATIINVTSQNLVDLTMKGAGLRKLDEGRILAVNPYKVPRIIGKQGSMVSMIKNETACNIVVGQNGLIWIDGQPEQELAAIRTIRKIEKESHLSGLTEKIKEYLAGNKGE